MSNTLLVIYINMYMLLRHILQFNKCKCMQSLATQMVNTLIVYI